MIHLFFSLIYIIFFSFTKSEDFIDYKKYKKTKVNLKIEEIAKGYFYYPWGMTFIDKNTLLVSEKAGRLLKVNIKSGVVSKIKHSIPHIKFNYGQGGLLDIHAHNDGYIYFTYSHDFNDKDSNGKSLKNSSTAVARGKLYDNKIIELETLLIARPKLKIDKHWGSRIVIKDDNLYVSFGERDAGMIAQDPQKHPGSIIRIKTNGGVPTDNPTFKGYEEWLPEIFQIGLRNPQGMTISPHDGKIFFSQHGPMGGDNLGIVKFAGNSGWKDIAWGGTEYSGRKIGNVPFKDIYDQNLVTWVPSIGVGSIDFYEGKVFPEWNGDMIISALKAKMLARIDFKNNKIVNQEIILKDHKKIGRIRDFTFDAEGNIYLVSDDDQSSLWKIYRN